MMTIENGFKKSDLITIIVLIFAYSFVKKSKKPEDEPKATKRSIIPLIFSPFKTVRKIFGKNDETK